MNERQNALRAARFDRPERIPVSFSIGSGCWNRYPQDALQELMAEHRLLFPDFQKSGKPVRPQHAPWRRADAPYTDSWGCVWRTLEDGTTGTVVEHALAHWGNLASCVPPSPEEQDGWGPIDWEVIRSRIAAARQHGRLARGSLRHGHTFLTLTYLRGYENLICDMADQRPELTKLLRMVEEFNLGLVQRYVQAGVEWMGYPEDLGMQRGPMLSPAHFRQYIKPVYRRLIGPAREAGCIIHMHSDGDVRDLMEDLLDVGVQVINIQDLVNNVDWMAAHLKGRVCIDLDIDRQQITRFGTPQDIDHHVGNAVRTLGSRDGGLMLKHGLYPGVPLENVKAVMDAMERYSQHFS